MTKMRYLLIKSSLDGGPIGVWLEDGKKLSAHFGTPRWNHREEVEAKDKTKLEDFIGQGYSYYSMEIGEYTGAKRVEIHSIIKQLEKEYSKQTPDVKSFRRPLKQEPYDPDARDADNDGIIQEGTPWERPVGARFLRMNGREFDAGTRMTSRPATGKLVDRDGKPVDYVPTYERSGPSSLGRTIGETSGNVATPKPTLRTRRKPIDISNVRAVKVEAPDRETHDGPEGIKLTQEDFEVGQKFFDEVTEKRAGLFDEVSYLDESGNIVTRKRDIRDEGEFSGFIEGGFLEAQEAKRNNAAELGALLARDLSDEDIEQFLKERGKSWRGGGAIVLRQNGQISFVSAESERLNNEVRINPNDPNYKQFAGEAIADIMIRGWTGIGAGMDTGVDEPLIDEMTEMTDRIFNGGTIPEDLSPRERVIAGFLLAQYENTQNRLREQGIESIVLHRGMTIKSDHELYSMMEEQNEFFGKVSVDLNALSASSFEYGTAAYSFGEVGDEGGIVVTMRVPRERIMSTSVTGMGSLSENEFVIIGTDRMDALVEWEFQKPYDDDEEWDDE